MMEAIIGKRSNFPRAARDYYKTPPEAVYPLIRHLPPTFTFCEPCAGDGALIQHIERGSYGACVQATDIEPQAPSIARADALSTSIYGVDLIITNPPWDRKILHPMIVHFSDMLPTWLLFDADWMHTRQSAPFLPRLRKVVSVGRVKWIPDSKMTGKDNCAWHLLDKPSDAPTEFYGRVA